MTEPAAPDDAELRARIAKAERATRLSKQRAEEADAKRKGSQVDLAKVTAANARQQQVCRELQLSTRALGGENIGVEEEERRQQLASKFDGTMGDIGGRIAEQEAEVERLRLENERTAARLASYREQHAAVLKHQAAELHTRELQEKLAVAQLREAEQLSHEQAQRNGVAELYLERQLTSEASAREQVAAYDERFAQLQQTLQQSAEARPPQPLHPHPSPGGGPARPRVAAVSAQAAGVRRSSSSSRSRRRRPRRARRGRTR